MIDMDSLPRWAIPVGIGGALGVVVLVTRGRGSSTLAPIPVPGQQPGGTTGSAEQSLNAFQQFITDLFLENAEAERLQNTAFFENLAALQASNAESITQALQAQSEIIQQGNAGFLEMLSQFAASFQAQIDALLSREPETVVTTQLVTIIDQYRQKFATAFERVGTPFGTRTPNTDIITGTLPDAPYAQDTGFTYYETTGHFVTGPFRQFLGNFGGARTYGRPLSQVFRDSDGYDTQIFENAIFKYVPGSSPDTFDIVVLQLLN